MLPDATAPGNAAVLRRLVEQLPSAAVYVDGERLFPNRHAEALTGYVREELPSLAEWFARLYPGRADSVRSLYERDRSQGFPRPRAVWLVRKDGEERLVEFAGSREQGAEVWLMRDATEPRRLARLMDQAARAARVGGWEVDCRTGRLFWTAETYRIHEVDPSEYTPEVETAVAFYAPESVPIIREAVRRGMQTGEGYDLELELITARRRRIWVRTVGAVELDEGRPARLYGAFQDITDRKRTEEALRRSEERQRRLIAASPDCLLELDLAGRVLSVNERGVELLGLADASEILGKGWLDGWPEGSQALAEGSLDQARRGTPGRFQAAGPNARSWDVEVVPILGGDGRPDRLLADARDITPLKRVEEERQRFERNLLQTQKLESLGVMAGGIAHDFNNLLTGIMGNAELVRLSGGPNALGLGYLAQIDAASGRAADLCRQMLAYAGKGRLVIQPVDLASLVRETVPLLHVSIPRKATLTICLPDSLPAIRGDAAQLSQVLMNLVINAAEALGEGEGLIAVSGRVQAVDAALLSGAQVGSDHPEGEYVCLEVSDTGCGMDEQTKARVFEPFFSTKFAGRGLGLAAVLGIVRGHRGVAHIVSRPGRGTTFRVYFPHAGDAPRPREVDPGPASWSEQGLILVIDDEDAVRQAAAGMCASLGFTVIQACDGPEGLRKAQESERVRLILLDWTMPRLDGAQVLRQLRQIRRDLPVIIMSGHGESEFEEKFAGMNPTGFLRKPFTLEQLRRRIREALDISGGGQ